MSNELPFDPSAIPVRESIRLSPAKLEDYSDEELRSLRDELRIDFGKEVSTTPMEKFLNMIITSTNIITMNEITKILEQRGDKQES
ncbi:MAG: hypothetical protein ACMG57_05045 [Candidatus Dojkabacteria bacterium]